MLDSELCVGFLAGVVVAGILGRLLQMILVRRLRAAQAAKKEIKVVTTQSPSEIHRASARARVEMFVLILVFVCAVAGGIAAVVALL